MKECEFELNKYRHDLIAIASPHIKVLKSPYLQALDVKNAKIICMLKGPLSNYKPCGSLCRQRTCQFQGH